jgi:protoporphyrinogen/coproporphyrinogen III oxidase
MCGGSSSSSTNIGVMPDFHVVVVGAGVSGLATAWYLKQEAASRGVPITCTVLEQSARAGGKIVSEFVDAEGRFVVEGGPDSFLAMQKPWGVRLAGQIGLSDRLIGTNDRDRNVYVVSRGRPLHLPEGIFMLAPTRLVPFLRSPLISPCGKLRMGMDLIIPRRTGDDDETLGDFVKRRFGREALDKIAEPLLSGIYSADVDRQSLLATFPRFREMEREHRSLIKAMRAGSGRRPNPPSSAPGAQTAAAAPAGASRPVAADGAMVAARSPRSAFVSLAGGMAELIEGLLAAVELPIEYGRAAQAIEPAGGEAGYHVHADDGRGGPRQGGVLAADAVVLATPAFAAADLLESLAPDAAQLLRTIRYVSSGTISLGYRPDASWAPVFAQLKGFGILVPASEKRPINAVTWSSVKFPGRAPAGHSLLRVFFGGSRSPRSMDLTEDELVRMVERQVAEIMGIREQPLFHRIYRWDKGIPQYDLGHLDRVAAIEASLPKGVYVTGSPYKGIGIPDCARQAADTARQVVEGLGRRGGASWT